MFMAPLEILPAKSDRFAQTLQLERSLALPAALFLWNSTESGALYHRSDHRQRARFRFQVWVFEHRGRRIYC